MNMGIRLQNAASRHMMAKKTKMPIKHPPPKIRKKLKHLLRDLVQFFIRQIRCRSSG
jgi:hypothetical protein